MKSLIYALGGFLNCKLRVTSCVLWVTLKLLVADYFCWDYKLRVMSWTLKLRVTKNFRDLTKKVAKVTKGEGDAARNIDATHTNFSVPIFSGTHIFALLCLMKVWLSLHKKWSFPLRISSINVTKFARNFGFGNI